MNYTASCWLSRGVVAAALAIIALMITQGVYGHTGLQDAFCLLGLYAVAFYGLIPKYVANWVFGLLLIVLLCTLTIMFPVHMIALFIVGGSILALIGTFA